MKRTADIPQILRSTVLPLVVGLAAGIAGSVTAEAWISPRLDEIPLAPFIRPVASVTAPLPEADLAARLATADLPIYARRSLRAGEPADRIVSESEAVGRAAVLTSDGWLVTHASAIPSGGALIGLRGRLIEPERSVADERTGAVFLKIAAGSLNVSGFEATETMREGSPVFAREDGRMYRSLYDGGVLPPRRGRLDVLQSSEDYLRVYGLSGRSLPGSAVLTIGGNLAGIAAPPAKDGGGATFLPMHLLTPVLGDVFRNQPIRRAMLGVHYLTLDGASASGAELPAAGGALIAGSVASGIPAVRSGSPAALAGLREGDVIARVDEVELSGRDLAELLGDYRSGDRVRLGVLRAGVQIALEAELR